MRFFAEGLAAGEPVVCAFAGHKQALIRDTFAGRSGIRFVDGDVHYPRPASAIRRYRQMIAEYVAAGASQIRISGDLPHPGLGVPWQWWHGTRRRSTTPTTTSRYGTAPVRHPPHPR